MRPLPVTPLAGTPPPVAGAAVVRGAPVPVVDLAALVGADRVAPPARFVLLRLGARCAALAVDGVVGVARVDSAAAEPLLSGAAAGAVASLGATLDGELLVVLRAARIVPEGAWRALAESEARA
jgi:purine-binding chemotaxis protein CheW